MAPLLPSRISCRRSAMTTSGRERRLYRSVSSTRWYTPCSAAQAVSTDGVAEPSTSTAPSRPQRYLATSRAW